MDIQITQIVMQMINFGLIVFLLSKFVYKPVIKILKQRTEKIEKSQLEAEKTLKQSEESASKAKSDITKAKEEADKIIAEAKKTAQTEVDEMVKKAKLDAKKAAETERQSQLSSLEKEKEAFMAELANLVTGTTSQVLQNGLSDADQHKLIAAQLASLKKQKVV